MFLIETGGQDLRPEADELPRPHAPLRERDPEPPRPADPLRRASTLHRNEPSGTLHGLLRVRHVTQDDAHIFCTREQIEDEVLGCLDYAAYLYDALRHGGALRALDAAGEQARRRLANGTSPRRRSPARSSGHGHRLPRERGRRRLLRAQDRPAHEGRPRALLADGDDPARRADAGAASGSITRARTTGSTRPTSSIARCSARSSGSWASSSSTSPATSRSGSPRSRCASCPSRTPPRGGRVAGRRPARAWLPRLRRRAGGDARAANPRRRAAQRFRSSSSGASASRSSRSPSAGAAASSHVPAGRPSSSELTAAAKV